MMVSRDFFNAVISRSVVTDEMVEYAQAQVAKMDTSNARATARTNAKRDEEYKPLIAAMVEYLKGCDTPALASEIAKAINVSTSKVAPLAKRIDNLVISEVKVKGGRSVKGYALDK